MALGLAAGVVQFALPESLGILVVIVAAFAAGWVLPEEPITAALLFLLPAIVLGTARALLGDEVGSVAPLVFGLAIAAMFTAFLTHIGAGVALRRRNAEQGGRR